jgi:hypothetical protein
MNVYRVGMECDFSFEAEDWVNSYHLPHYRDNLTTDDNCPEIISFLPSEHHRLGG